MRRAGPAAVRRVVDKKGSLSSHHAACVMDRVTGSSMYRLLLLSTVMSVVVCVTRRRYT